MTKEEIQELYRKSSDYSSRMFWIRIKNLFLKNKIDEAHWTDDSRWWHLEYNHSWKECFKNGN